MRTQNTDASQASQDMRRHSGPFGLLPAALIYDPHIGPAAKVVYGALACHADGYDECYPKQLSIARALGVTQSAVAQAVTQLVDAGYVHTEMRLHEGHTRPRLHYFLNWQVNRTRYQDGRETNISSPNTSRISSPNISSPNAKNNTSRENREYARTSSLSGEVLSNRAYARGSVPTAPAKKSAAIASRTHDDYGWLETDPLAAAFRQLLPAPTTKREKGRWASAIKNLRDAGATPDDITVRGKEFRARWPRLVLTPTGLESNWSELGGSQHAQSEQQRRQAQEAQRRIEDDLARQSQEAARQIAIELYGAEAVHAFAAGPRHLP